MEKMRIAAYLAIIGGIISLTVAGILYLPILGGVGGLATTTLLGAKSQIAHSITVQNNSTDSLVKSLLTAYDNYTINNTIANANSMTSGITSATSGNMGTIVLLFVMFGIVMLVGGILAFVMGRGGGGIGKAMPVRGL